jgi:hypothetical protein
MEYSHLYYWGIHQLIEVNNESYASLGVITFFVLGLLVFRKFVKIPKWLAISFLISYLLLLFNILYYFVWSHISESFKSIGVFCFAAVIWPSFIIICSVEGLTNRLFGKDWLFESGRWVVFDWIDGILCLLSFFLNALVIFAIIKLFLYIKHKVFVKNFKRKHERSLV